MTPSFLFFLQPLTGRLWRVDPKVGRAWIFEFDRRRWRQIDAEKQAREMGEHEVLCLNDCDELTFDGDSK